MIRVALFPADTAACGYYRMIYPSQAAGHGGGIEMKLFLESVPVRRDASWKIRGTALRADVAVFQRPMHHEVPEVIPHLQAAGIAVVVELDDDFSSLHPSSAVFDIVHPTNPAVNWHHLKRCCQLADLVTVTTPALAARFGGAGKARVLPNLVPAWMLLVNADRDGRTVGWGGRTDTHVGDLAITAGGVADAIGDTAARFLSVGRPDGVRRDLRLAAEPDTTGGLEFGDYHRALAQLDVGIAPLADTVFNRAKSGLKMLEYAALGIAAVGSPRPDNQRLHDAGIGLLARDGRGRDWRRHITQLLRDPVQRAELAAAGREIVAERFTYERNGWLWAEAWHDAVEIRRNGKAAA